MNTVSEIRNGNPNKVNYRYNYVIEYTEEMKNYGSRTVLSDRMEDVTEDVRKFIRDTVEDFNKTPHDTLSIIDIRVYGLCRTEYPQFDQQDFHENVIVPALKDALK